MLTVFPTIVAAQTSTDEGMQETIALSTQTQNRIRNLAANISNRFDATIERLQQISSRVASREQKQITAGLNTAEATTQRQQGEHHLQIARSNMEHIDTRVEQAITATDPSTAWTSVHTHYTQTARELQTSYDALYAAALYLHNNLSTSTDMEQ